MPTTVRVRLPIGMFALMVLCLTAPARGESEQGVQTMQYFKPEGSFFVGDCMPFFHEGVYHFIYLLDDNHHHGRDGRGGHQWAQATTRDLVHWEHHPLAIGITEDWEGSICTGSVFYWDGLYRGYYASRKMDWSEYLSVAISKDGIHFEKTEPRFFAPLDTPYISGLTRDPFVFRDEKTGLFHLIATGVLREPQFAGRDGCLVHLTSGDLVKWKTEAPFLVPGILHQPVECSELFSWNGWYYLVYSSDGRAQYRMSRDPLGHWTRPPVDLLDSPMARVMKSAEFTGDRRIGTAFLPTLENDKDNGSWQYAGNAVFREIVQDKEGFLWIKFPPELTPKAGPPAELKPVSQPEGVLRGATETQVSAVGGMNAVCFPSCPLNARITCEIVSKGAYEFGLGLRASADYGQGYDLLFTPAREKVDLHPCTMGNFDENAGHAIYSVDGLDQPVRVEILMKEDIIDVAIETEAQKRCLINRCIEHRGDHLFLFARDGDVVFRNLQVCPLVEP
jgi:beta-fructofuranosidase